MASPPTKHRTASLHDEAYRLFVKLIVQKRMRSGYSQQALADALGWNQSIIAKIESVQRRLDIIELTRIANVLEFDASKLVKQIQQSMKQNRTS
jgi:ribosome-binding protein aMBF1 (putative translation factor)